MCLHRLFIGSGYLNARCQCQCEHNILKKKIPKEMLALHSQFLLSKPNRQYAQMYLCFHAGFVITAVRCGLIFRCWCLLTKIINFMLSLSVFWLLCILEFTCKKKTIFAFVWHPHTAQFFYNPCFIFCSIFGCAVDGLSLELALVCSDSVEIAGKSSMCVCSHPPIWLLCLGCLI